MDKNIGDKDKRFDSRLLFVFLIFWILLLLIFGATIKLKVVERDEWVELEKKRILQKREYKAKRGNIYSIDPDNGEYLLLATNEPLYDVYVDLGKAKRKEKGITQRQMSQLLGVSEANVSRWESFQRRSLIAYFGYKKILGGE